MHRRVLLVPPLCGLLAIAACSGKTLTKGELMVSVQTDMSLPKDIDRIGIQVSVHGVISFAEEYAVGQGALLIPATFGVVQGNSPSEPVQIRVLARKSGQLLVLRDAITTVPTGRVATLRMPVEYLCQGQATDGTTVSDPTTQDQTATSDCGDGMTCVAGACITSTIDSATLPDYEPAQVFGGASAPGAGGQCLDTVGCFASGYVASVNLADCTIASPSLAGAASGDGINVALASGPGGAGICGSQACLVPLDESSAEGWSDLGNGRIELPSAVCPLLMSHTIDSVVVTTSCAAKTPATPTCGPWSSAQAEPATFEAGAPEGAASPLEDAGVDATLPTSDAGEDASAPEDAQVNCPALLAALATAPIKPPFTWFNLDLSNGAGFNGAWPDGGISIDGTSLAACASFTEPQTLPAGLVPQEPGSRTIALGGSAGDASAPFSVSYNSVSKTIDLVLLSRPATGSVSFSSRAGGAYETGGVSNQYVISLAGSGSVTKNGADFPLVFNDAGGAPGNDWLNEIYDGLMATYDPTGQGITTGDGGGLTDCTNFPLYPNPTGVEKHVPACFSQLAPSGSGTQYVGIRPLQFFFGVDAATNHVSVMYQFWPGGEPSCASTPAASLEQMDFAPIQLVGNFNPNVGATWQGTSIGTVSPSEVFSDTKGLLETEAAQILCNGTSATPIDPGYTATQWGSSGEVLLEYDTTQLAYRLFARSGYKGNLTLPTIDADGGAGPTYVVAPGAFTADGVAQSLDWAGGTAGVDALVTAVSNAWLTSWCGVSPDTDCLAAGDCQIVTDDGAGNSSFTLITSPTVVSNYCGTNVPPLTVTFPQGTSVPSSISTTNLAYFPDGGG